MIHKDSRSFLVANSGEAAVHGRGRDLICKISPAGAFALVGDILSIMSREAESKGRIWFMAGKVF